MPDEPKALPDPGAVHDQREIDAVIEVLRTSNLTIGPKVAEFEAAVAKLLSKQHGVMVNSGSSALRLAIDLLGLQPGDEIITPALTFSTDIAPMVQSGIVPVFVDVTPDTFQIDADRIDEMVGPRTKAILAPNLAGNCPDWDRIREVADAHGLRVVEDSCDVLDSHLRGRRTGERADISVTSFARGHAITAAGNGGMVGVDEEELLDLCLMLRRWGRRSETYLFGSRKGEREHFGPLADGTPYDLTFLFDRIGYNFEPSEIGAAYGLVQLEKLADYNGRRKSHWQRLDGLFEHYTEIVDRPRTTDGADTVWMRYPFLLREGIDRSVMQRALHKQRITSLMVWSGNILRHPGFASVEHRKPAGGLPNSDRVTDSALSLPSHHALSSDDLGRMMTVVADVFDDVAKTRT
ncbi:MAG TPA: DegT/DnrJ/EryC1/StrS family aminotransferase [Acidimicrobiia bacterium]|jgi:CDP-6-deoxy-D-xylo-4-hexulose-3-dehydrase